MTNLAEFERLEVLRGLKVLDTPTDARLDAITILAKMYFDVPIALVSLVDECRQWFKSRQGLTATETHRDLAFCHHAIQQSQPLIVPDAQLDERFASNDLVTGPPHIRFYAGAPIIVDGHALGTVCVIDMKPRQLEAKDVKQLESVAEMAARFLKSYKNEDVTEFFEKSALAWERDEALKKANEAHDYNYDSTDFLKLILEAIPHIVYVRNSQFKLVRGNSAFFDIFPENERNDIIGTTGFDYVSDEIASIVMDQDRKAFENGFAVSTKQVELPNGGHGTFYTKRIRFEDRSGEKFVMGISEDISRLVESEKAVLEAKEFQDLMFEQMPDMIFVKDDQFRIVQANENFLKAYPEHMRDSVIGTTTLEQYSIDERNAFLAEDRRALEEGYSEVEESIEFPDGERRILLTRKVRFEDQENQRFILGIARDITELVEARKQRERLLELLDTVVNTVTSAVLGLNARGEIVTINKSGRRMLSCPDAEGPFNWPSDIEFLDVEDLQPLVKSQDPVARALIGIKIGGEVHLMRHGSTSNECYVRVTSALVKSEGSPLHTVIVLDDVSEAERNRQSAERQARLDALGQLTGGIAHDFNNLLNTMQYAIELLRREDLSERGQRSANAAIKSIQRGSELTDRLLAFAKKQPARSTARSLKEVVVELKDLVLPVIETSVTVEFDAVDENLFVFCDQGQLQNAILNLVINSRDAITNSQKGHLIGVNIRAVDSLPTTEKPQMSPSSDNRSDSLSRGDFSQTIKQSQRFIEIAVTDNGPGMPDEVAARAVDPFFTTKDVHSGTGLGLSMVYGFVEQSGGEMRIYTEEGNGTTVKLFLPRGDKLSGIEAPVTIAPLLEGQGETILVVEDEEFLLEQLNDLLNELNYKTVQARSGCAALEMLKAGIKADLILTDVVMPGGVGGFELARLAREILPDVPVIYMSGYTGFSNEEMGEVIAPLLPKPSTPAQTSKQIRDVLEKASVK